MCIRDRNNRHITEILDWAVGLCKPAKVTVITDDKSDIDYVRRLALQNGEETALAIPGHTVHFDNYRDQARDKNHTCVLLPKGKTLSKHINAIDYDDGLEEIYGLMDGIMAGKEMLVRFFSLGPQNSLFSIPAMQITDSAYVAHSEDLLYRSGYEYFRRLPDDKEVFWMLHSSGLSLIHI